MNGDDNRADELSVTKRALLTVRRLRARIEELEGASREPIAIVGLSCRFPGPARNPEAFWQLLWKGEDAVGPAPVDRLAAPGTRGGFLEAIDLFDRDFFGISPSEAARMDPQHRLLLEITWEALEDAGLPADRLRSTSASVFVGVSTNDYWLLQDHLGCAADMRRILGSSHAALAGRISYALDLRGPALAIDTACTSALVATHYACESLRRRESSLAIVGGVNVMLVPEVTAGFAEGGFVSSGGRCRSFDSEADGFVRSEGCGVLVLKRLSDAVADGDPLRAVLRGSAVNQNGRGAGLVAPNGPAQVRLVREALANAEVEASDVGYVEAHGSATALGDCIELEALKTALEGQEEERPCLVGSVKANLGHLEAASGMAALVKTILVVERGEIPPQPNFQRLNPNAALDGSRLRVSTSACRWHEADRPRLASVHSFAFSGTNAHLLVEQAPCVKAPTLAGGRRKLAQLLPLSARSEPALAALAAAYAQRLRSLAEEETLADVCFCASVRRSHHAYRAAAVGADAARLAKTLDELAVGPSGRLATGRLAPGRRKRCLFVFSDAGRPHADALGGLLGWSIFGKALDAAKQTCQSAGLAISTGDISSFCVGLALAELWRAWGCEPDAVVGQGVGELSAACVAGEIGAAEAAILMHRSDAPIAPSATPAERTARRGCIPLHSAAGPALDPAQLTRDGWRARRSNPTRLGTTVADLAAKSFDVIVELGPTPCIDSAAQAGLKRRGICLVQTPLIVQDPRAAMLGGLAELYAKGLPVNWDRVYPEAGRVVRLPTYPWNRERCWRVVDESEPSSPKEAVG